MHVSSNRNVKTIIKNKTDLDPVVRSNDAEVRLK